MDPYGQYFSPYLGMGNNPVSSVDPDGGKTDDPPRMLDEVTVKATRLPSFWQGMKNSFSRADAWFSGRGGMQLAQTIADLNPLMSVAHLVSQVREGTNAYGKKMSGMDIASKAADLVPFGAAANAGRKGLLMLGKGVGRLAGGSGQAVQGIYEFTAVSGKTYVGQSKNIALRLQQHIKSGKLLPGTPVKTTQVLGGKTAREIAEQLRINSFRRH